MEADRKATAYAQAAAHRATEAQALEEDAERLIGAWNERQATRVPLLFSPTIGAALACRHWYLWVRCPACRPSKGREGAGKPCSRRTHMADPISS